MSNFEDIIKRIKQTPYYQDSETVIYCADCRDILPQIPEGSIDLILTDPPYNEKAIECYELLSKYGSKVLKEGGLVVAYAGTMFLDKVISALTKGLSWVWLFNCQYSQFSRVWEYKIMQTSKPILVVSKGISCKLNWLRTDINPEGKDKFLHRWQQSEGLPALFIAKTEANIILEPYLGSGTTCYCAKKLGRKSIGIEISEKYCEIAAKRLSQSVMKLDIPQPKPKCNGIYERLPEVNFMGEYEEV